MTNKIEFTKSAINEIERITAIKGSTNYFRITVKGGGCSGFKYDFSFDDKVKKLIKTCGLTLASRSKKDEVKRSTQVLLGDTIGELNFLYSLSDVAFVGGSLIDHGGQNLLEPAAQSLALLSGPSLRNFSDISEQLKQNEGLKIVNDSRELSDRFIEYIEDHKARF